MLADAAQLASLADETPEGRSIVVLAKEKFGLREREIAGADVAFVPFSAQTRMSGVEHARPQHPQGRRRRGRETISREHGGEMPPEVRPRRRGDRAARAARRSSSATARARSA